MLSSPPLEVGLSLGSNLGDRMRHLDEAILRVSGLSCLDGVKCSPAYETAPVDVPAEFDHLRFLNLVLVAQCRIGPDILLPHLNEIETSMGRTRAARGNAPRTIDIDIIYAGGMVIDTDELTLPHPRWSERVFVVKPLNDLRPDLVVPGASMAVGELLATLAGRDAPTRG